MYIISRSLYKNHGGNETCQNENETFNRMKTIWSTTCAKWYAFRSIQIYCFRMCNMLPYLVDICNWMLNGTYSKREPLARCLGDAGSLHGHTMDDGVVVDRHRRFGAHLASSLPQRPGPTCRNCCWRPRRVFHLPHNVPHLRMSFSIINQHVCKSACAFLQSRIRVHQLTRIVRFRFFTDRKMCHAIEITQICIT